MSAVPSSGDLVRFDYDKNEAEWQADYPGPELWTPEIRASDNHTGEVIGSSPSGDNVTVKRITDPLKGQTWFADADSLAPWDGES